MLNLNTFTNTDYGGVEVARKEATNSYGSLVIQRFASRSINLLHG